MLCNRVGKPWARIFGKVPRDGAAFRSTTSLANFSEIITRLVYMRTVVYYCKYNKTNFVQIMEFVLFISCGICGRSYSPIT